jgi:hypothetical protein
MMVKIVVPTRGSLEVKDGVKVDSGMKSVCSAIYKKEAQTSYGASLPAMRFSSISATLAA